MMRVAVLVVVVIFSSLAVADEADVSEARRHFEAGANAYALGDYTRAIEEYKASYDRSPLSARPLLLFDLGQAYRKAGNYVLALHSYKQYLGLAPRGRYRADAQEQVTALEPLVDAQQRATAAPPDVVVGPESGQEPVAPRPPAALPVVPRPAVATPATTVPAASAAVVSSPTELYRPWYKSAVGWSLCGAGLATVAVGAGLLGAIPGIDDQAASALSLQSQYDLAGRAKDFRIAGITLVTVGAAALVAGGVTLIVASRHHRSWQ